MMNGFWCCTLGLHRTYHVCQVLGCCLDAACLPIDHFFYYRSKDKSPFTALPSLRVRNTSCLSFIYGAKPTETKCGVFEFWYRSTTKELRASLANQAFPLLYGPIWVGSSAWSLQFTKRSTRVRQSTQLSSTRFEILLAPERGGCSITI